MSGYDCRNKYEFSVFGEMLRAIGQTGHHQVDCLWPWPPQSNQVISRGLLNIHGTFHRDCSSRSWDIVVTRSVWTNKRGGWTDRKHNAFVDNVRWRRHKTQYSMRLQRQIESNHVLIVVHKLFRLHQHTEPSRSKTTNADTWVTQGRQTVN